MIEIATVIAERVAEEAYQILKDRALDDIEPRLAGIEERLCRVEDKLDQQLLAPLRSGLMFLRLSDIPNATTELVRAVGLEPYSAVAKMWLGVALSAGNERAALEQVQAAVALNSFLLKPGAVRLGEPRTLSESRSKSLDVPNKQLRRHLPGKVRRHLRLTRHHANAFIRSTSVASGHLIIFGSLGHSWKFELETAISCCDLSTGRLRWQKLLRNASDVAFTPLHVIIQDPEKDTVTLVDSDRGDDVRVFRRGYFDAVFGPVPMSSRQLEWLGEVTACLRSPSDVLAVTSKPLDGKRWGPDHGVLHEDFNDSAACGIKDTIVTVTNSWRHCHVVAPPPPSAPFCDLWATARLQYELS